MNQDLTGLTYYIIFFCLLDMLLFFYLPFPVRKIADTDNTDDVPFFEVMSCSLSSVLSSSLILHSADQPELKPTSAGRGPQDNVTLPPK